MEMRCTDKTMVMVVLTFIFFMICSVATASEATYAALDPRGEKPTVKLIPLAERPSDLNGKVVYIINSMPHGSGMDDYLVTVGDALKKKYPSVEIIPINRGAGYMRHDAKQAQEIVAKANAYIYGGTPTGSLTAAAFFYAAELEKAGVPGMVLTYTTLTKVAKSSSERVGAPLRFLAVAFPPENMNNQQRIDAEQEIISALTKPLTASEKKEGMYTPPKPPRIAITGTLDEIQDYFYSNGLSDGLPIIPPTEEKVAAMLKGTSHAPDEVVAAETPPEKYKVTVEKVAINGVMAGCKPKYMPVLLASVEAFVKARGGGMTSTNSFSIMQVVNGPIRKEIDMNADLNAMGPGNQANSTLGRALTLFKTNLGGGEVGVNMMGVQGNVGLYSFTFAENEEKSPWEPLSVEKGFKPGESTLSIFSGGWSHVGNYYQVEDGLDFLAKDMSVFEYPSGAVALISAKRASLIKEEGLSKADVKAYIQQHSTSTLKEFRASGYFGGLMASMIKRRGQWPKSYLTDPDDKVVPVYPEGSIEVVVVGGETAPMMQGWKMSYVTTVSIDKWR